MYEWRARPRRVVFGDLVDEVRLINAQRAERARSRTGPAPVDPARVSRMVREYRFHVLVDAGHSQYGGRAGLALAAMEAEEWGARHPYWYDDMHGRDHAPWGQGPGRGRRRARAMVGAS
ncbi:hypothetical protein SCMU_14500 [Sinomonas cyclohexanicum]|uniref:Uncharacterized protein n=1 Tax=Sinomonas cyclohexanicum TaxID=322009 RepID=A0ABN6FIE4_SINCY|nr:hypothetical protein SCMU_14500 [Corynebacterium cyclohexanicum]